MKRVGAAQESIQRRSFLSWTRRTFSISSGTPGEKRA